MAGLGSGRDRRTTRSTSHRATGTLRGGVGRRRTAREPLPALRRPRGRVARRPLTHRRSPAPVLDWSDLSARASKASHRLIGWIYWDPDAIAAYAALGVPN